MCIRDRNYQREQIFYNGRQDNNQNLEEKNRKTDKKVEKTPNNQIKVEVSKHHKLKCRPVYAIRQYQIDISGKSFVNFVLFSRSHLGNLIEALNKLKRQENEEQDSFNQDVVEQKEEIEESLLDIYKREICLLYTSPSPRDS